jgi:hypothetical protein
MSASARFVVLSSVLALTSVSCGAAPGVETNGDDTEVSVAAALPSAGSGIDVTVVAPVRPAVTTDEHRHLLYELVITNSGTTAATLTGVDSVSVGGHDRADRLQGDALAAAFLSADPQAPALTVSAGSLGVVFIDSVWPRAGELPRAFKHVVRLERAGQVQAIRGPTADVIDEDAAPISSPLRGPDFLDLNGCCDGAHRRALIDINGALDLAQRFAIDFVQVDLAAAAAGDDPFTHGDPTKNESYLIFGAPILAVGSGEIVDVRDGVPENDLTQPLPTPDIQSAPGNYVVERLGAGRFALYAHMQTGSVAVKVGDRVARGQVLGQVGNTGNSTMPHLHFHVMDGPSPLGSDGLPYRLDRFDLEGTTDLSSDNPTFQPTPPPNRRRDRLPMGGDILSL